MTTHHERMIGDFYSEFPYPWHVARLARCGDPALYPALVSQEVGDYGHRRLPPDCRIWVPGCGVNQALMTALRFPAAHVVGSDVSEESLRMCAAAAEQVGAGNLELREEGIEGSPYREEFDYIVCTGVIHHNPDPGALLARLAAALRPEGLLELMVYNTFHRREITAFQEALRLIGHGQDVWSARRLAGSIDSDNQLTARLRAELHEPEIAFADTWLNPCERTFTVGGLHDLCAAAGLVLEAPCVSELAKASGAYSWELPVRDERLGGRLRALPDLVRWQVGNLLLFDRSPLLWFYLRRRDNPLPLAGEDERDEAFLDAVPTRVRATERVWLLEESGGYRPMDGERPVSEPAATAFPQLLADVDGRRTVRDLCGAPGGTMVRRMRAELATPAGPHLVARVAG
ncbi:hypothetical protein Aph01nite_59660 [Acrocarpospora phusangensis]|uniref:Methyltransferase type 11 domain-containing protein n=1 Tax=Acrocarpospora phusangensis TaxID=1070424 RepID=A0A919QF13_9ACTN|nr:class I SAM-dependent methyltransferase [Acrocarpospora phusangensis]GIH27656.1 hypothetical protein Aph01nite_59660 [Acrocarpospora phusangensis]